MTKSIINDKTIGHVFDRCIVDPPWELLLRLLQEREYSILPEGEASFLAPPSAVGVAKWRQ
jgi:hypothetical protein